MQTYGHFDENPLIILHEVWVGNIMTPVNLNNPEKVLNPLELRRILCISLFSKVYTTKTAGICDRHDC